MLRGYILFDAYRGSFPLIKRPVPEASSCQYNSTYTPHLSSFTCCYYYKDQRGETRLPSKNQFSFGKRGTLDTKVLSLLFFLKYLSLCFHNTVCLFPIRKHPSFHVASTPAPAAVTDRQLLICLATFLSVHFVVYRGADKSLARPGRKQATATEDFDVHISYL
jgi:hypothetical protein